MSAVLNLVPCIGYEADVLLNLLYSSARAKILEGTPLTVQTDGSKEKGITAISFVIYNVIGSELVHCRYVGI